jgi:DNA-binding IclR family transcriptional regulator
MCAWKDPDEERSGKLRHGHIAVLLAVAVLEVADRESIIKMTNLSDGYVRNILGDLIRLNIIKPIKSGGLGFLFYGQASSRRRTLYQLAKPLKELVREYPEIMEEVVKYKPDIKTVEELLGYINELRDKWRRELGEK